MKKVIAIVGLALALGAESAQAEGFSAGPVVSVPVASDMELRGRDVDCGVMYGARAEYGRFGLMVTHGSGSAEWTERVAEPEKRAVAMCVEPDPEPEPLPEPKKELTVRRSVDVDITTAMVYGKLPITCGIDAVGGLGLNVVSVDDETGVGLAAVLGIEARRDLGGGFTGSVGVAGDINQGVEGLDEWMSLKAVAGVVRVF